MAKTCKLPGMPDKATICRWLALDSDFCDKYLAATSTRAHILVDECIDIADDSDKDFSDTTEDGMSGKYNAEHVQRSKLRVETRLKVIGLQNPKKYGAAIKQEISGPDGGDIPIAVTVKFVEPEADNGSGNG